MQEEIVLLSHIFSNKFNDFIDSSNNKDIISYYLKKNAISP